MTSLSDWVSDLLLALFGRLGDYWDGGLGLRISQFNGQLIHVNSSTCFVDPCPTKFRAFRGITTFRNHLVLGTSTNEELFKSQYF